MFPRYTYQQGFDPDLLGAVPMHQPRRIDPSKDVHNLFCSPNPVAEETISISKEADLPNWTYGNNMLYLDISGQSAQVVVAIGETFQVKVQDLLITCKHIASGNAILDILLPGDGEANTMQLKKSSVLGKMLRVLKLTPL